jgi:hypothetical protein
LRKSKQLALRGRELKTTACTTYKFWWIDLFLWLKIATGLGVEMVDSRRTPS